MERSGVGVSILKVVTAVAGRDGILIGAKVLRRAFSWLPLWVISGISSNDEHRSIKPTILGLMDLSSIYNP